MVTLDVPSLPAISRRTLALEIGGALVASLLARLTNPLGAVAAQATPDATPSADVPISVVILFGVPADPAAFESYYLTTHVPLAQQIPAAGYDMGQVLSTLDGSPPPYYRIAILHLDNAAQLQTALTSPEGQTALADVANFATGGATVLVISGPTAVPLI